MIPIYTKNRTIGLLGGSFNPAHAGHLHITLHALKTMRLDEVWWLVSPKNPLKSSDDLAAYTKRLQSAHEIAGKHTRIRVMDIEAKKNLRYSYETVVYLQRRFSGAHFVWLMGADNLAQFHRWRRWQELLTRIPVAVFDRVPYSHTALRSKTFLRIRRFCLKNSMINAKCHPPYVQFIHLRRHPLSATMIRKRLGTDIFLRHNEGVG